MHDVASHIVSGIRWQTSFDDKEQATRLQERLSNWSEKHLPKELVRVFDSICPPGQTWRIPLLDVDLGVIELANLERELTKCFYEGLSDKLTSLLLHANRGNSDIKILNDRLTQEQLISSFLLHGYMPWSYRAAGGGINEMLANQLHNNRRSTIALLKSLASMREDIRKRMAWQFSESNTVLFVQGVEPGNANTILSFADAMTTIQQKETVVQTGISEFRKSLWLWILNYLFTERGSLFNKVAYLKSSIRQMAGHYNIGYTEILLMIERAARQVSRQYGIMSDFLVTLGLLMQEDHAGNRYTLQKEFIAIESLQAMSDSLRQLHLYNTASGKVRLGEIIYRFTKNHPAHLQQALQGDTIGILPGLLSVIPYLKPAARHALFTCYNPSGAIPVIRRIGFLSGLCKAAGLAAPGTLWQTGFVLLHKHNGNPFNPKTFFEQSIRSLSRLHHLTPFKLVARLLQKEPCNKTSESFIFYEELTDYCLAEVAQHQQAVSGISFKQLLLLWQQYLTDRKKSSATLATLQQVLIKSIRQQPAAALPYLQACLTRNSLSILIDSIDEKTRLRLLDKAAVRNNIIAKMTRLLMGNESNTATGNNRIALPQKKEITRFALVMLLAHPQLQLAEFAKAIADKFPGIRHAVQMSYLATIDSRVINTVEFQIASESIDPVINRRKRKTILFRIHRLIQGKADARMEISRLLTKHYHNRSITRLRRELHAYSNAARVINYLLPGGLELIRRLTEQYKYIILSSTPSTLSSKAVVTRLQDIFWDGLFRFESHGGNSTALVKLFSQAVMRHFPVLRKNCFRKIAATLLPEKKDDNNAIRLRQNLLLPFSEVAVLLKQMIASSKISFLCRGSVISLNEVLNLALEKCPGQVKAVLEKMTSSPCILSALQGAVPFEQFLSAMINSVSGARLEALEAIRLFYEMTTRFLPVSAGEQLTGQFWKLTVQAIKNNHWPAGLSDKIIRPLLHHLRLSGKASVEEIITALQNRNLPLPVLKRLTRLDPVFMPLQKPSAKDKLETVLLAAQRHHQLDKLISAFISHQKVPLWIMSWFAGLKAKSEATGQRPGQEPTQNTTGTKVSNGSTFTEKALLTAIATRFPGRLLQALQQQSGSRIQALWISRLLPFAQLAGCIENTDAGQASLITMLEKLYTALGTASFAGIDANEVQHLLMAKIVNAWVTGHWKSVDAIQIWNELLWEVHTQKGIARPDFIAGLQTIKDRLPPALQLSLENSVAKSVTYPAGSPVKKQVPPPPFFSKKTNLETQTRWPVKNAGLVLVSSYIPLLFKRLGIAEQLSNVDEKNEVTSSDAVHYLQYIVTGHCATSEHLLMLNKLLCGLPLQHPVQSEIDMTDADRNLIDEMIQAIISHWPAIGACSADGFRGNWLVRDGLLAEEAERWELTVEKQAYDILLNKSPFSFSIIKYPWMPKPLHVHWSY